jgi:hypothetical protein
LSWKKEKPATDVISHESEDQRSAYRYQFRENQGFEIKFQGKTVRVLDISAGGMAFKNNGFKLLDFDFIKFTLDIPNFTGDNTFFAGLRILKISEDETCHCLFEQCSLDQHELIHKYVLEMQKNDLAH